MIAYVSKYAPSGKSDKTSYTSINDGFNHIFLVILTNNLLMIEAIGFLSIIVEIA